MALNMRVFLLLVLACIVDTKSWEATVDFARLLSSENETVNTTTQPPADENQTSTTTTGTITATETILATITGTETVTATETTTMTMTRSTATYTTTTTPQAEFKSPGVMCWGNSWYFDMLPEDLPEVRQLHATQMHQCAISESGVGRCWGHYAYMAPLPEDLGPVIDIKMFGYAAYHVGACAIKEANLTLVCWGTSWGLSWDPDLSWVPSQVVEFDVAYEDSTFFLICVLDVQRTMTCDPNVLRDQSETVNPFDPVPNVIQMAIQGKNRCTLTQAGITCDIGEEWRAPWYGYPQGAMRTIAVAEGGVCAIMEAGHLECTTLVDVPFELTASGTKKVAELFSGNGFFCARLEGETDLNCFGPNPYNLCQGDQCIPSFILNYTVATAGHYYMCVYGEFDKAPGMGASDVVLFQCGQTVRGSARGYRSVQGDPWLPEVSITMCALESGGFELDTCQTDSDLQMYPQGRLVWDPCEIDTWWRFHRVRGDLSAGECVWGFMEVAQVDTDYPYEVTLHCFNTTTTTTSTASTSTASTSTETTTTKTMAHKLYVHCWGGLAARGLEGVEIGAPAKPFGRSLAMASGPRHQCIVLPSQSVECWPPGLGTGRGFPRVTDVKIHGSENPSACGITIDQRVVCWGTMQLSVPQDISGVVSLAVGGDDQGKYVCVALAGGTVTCFGTATESSVLDVPTYLDEVIQVDAGGQSTCALHEDGNITCWGMISSLGSFDSSWGVATSVSVGQRHACAVMEDGYVKCWGDNTLSQTSVPPSLRSRFVSAGTDYTCAIDEDQHFRPVCWGDTERFGPMVDPWGPDFVVPPRGTDWSWMLSVGDSHACALSGNYEQVIRYPAEMITCDPSTSTGSAANSTIGKPNLLGDDSGDHAFLFCPTESGTYTFDTCGESWDTIIRIYDHLYFSDSGGGAGKWYNDDAGVPDCGFTIRQSKLSVFFEPGYCYYVLVEGWGNNEGDFTLNLHCPVPTTTQTTSTTTSVTTTTSTATTSTRTTTTATTTTETSSTSTVTTMSTVTTVTSTTVSSTTTNTTMTISTTTTTTATTSTMTDTSTTSVTTRTQMTTKTTSTTTISATTSTVSTTTATTTTFTGVTNGDRTTTETIITVVTTTMDNAVPATTTTLAAVDMTETMAAAEQAEENLVQDLLTTGGETARTEVPGGVVVASKLTTQANSGQSATVVLENSVVKVDVPAAVLSSLVPDGDDVVLLLTEFKAPITDSSSGQEVKVQGAVRIEFMAIRGNQARRVTVGGMSEAMEFTLPVPYTPGGLQCSFFDEALKQWSTAGVSLSDKSVDGQPIVCLTTHLSLFGALPIIVDPFIPNPCSETAGVLGTIVFWSIVGVCVVLFLLGVYTDIQTKKSAWPDEYLMIPASTDRESQSGGVSCCQALCKALKSGGARMIAREGASLAAGKGYCAGPETIARRVVVTFTRRAVGAALRLGDDMVNLVLEDQALRDMLVARKDRIEALGPAAFKEAQTREDDLAKGWRTANNQEDCLVGLHASLCKAVNTVVEAQLPDEDPTDDGDPVVPVRTQVGYGSRVFLVQNPLGMHTVLDMSMSRKMKSFLFLVQMTCTLLLTAVLLQAVGLFDMSGACDEEEGDVILGIPMVLVAYIISRFVVFNLKSFRARTFVKVESEGCREWFQQLGTWSFQDGIVMCVGVAVIGAGMAVTHLLLAEAGGNGHMGFSIGAFIAVGLDFLLLPLLTAFFPSLLNCICLDTAAIESVSDDFDRDVPVTLNKALGNDPAPVPVAPAVAENQTFPRDSPDQQDLPGNDEVPAPSQPKPRIKASL